MVTSVEQYIAASKAYKAALREAMRHHELIADLEKKISWNTTHLLTGDRSQQKVWGAFDGLDCAWPNKETIEAAIAGLHKATREFYSVYEGLDPEVQKLVPAPWNMRFDSED